MGTEKKSGKNILNILFGSSTSLVAIVLIILVVVATVFSPYFLTFFNIQSLLRDIAFMAIVACGQSMLLLIGELDLSVGKIASLSGILGGLLMTKTGTPAPLAFVIGILIGAGLGFINGFLITSLRINPMVATIGMQGVYSGVTMVITKGQAITNMPQQILFIGQGNIGPIPIPFIVAIVVLIVIVFIVTKTHFGRYVYAMGNSAEAASIMGINVGRMRIMVYCITGLLSSTAGMIYLARLGSAQATIGTNWPMNSIAACVIGGIALTGGIGHPVGAFLGAMITSVIANVIVLFGVNIYWQEAVNGIVVVIAIALPSLINIIKARRHIKVISAE